MDFTFSNDQLLFQESVKTFFEKEVTTSFIRNAWKSESGRSDKLWQMMAELGLCGFTVPEKFGGLGLTELDFVLLAQACGYYALPEPLVHTVLVAAPLINDLPSERLKLQWLPSLAQGQVKVAVGLEENQFVEDAHVSSLLLMQQGSEIHAIKTENTTLTLRESVNPSRKLFEVQWSPTDDSCVASNNQAQQLINRAFQRGALGCAAQSLGLTQRMLDMSVRYSQEREQFGKPIGSFQALKHQLADVAVRWEYAKAPVYRAAYSVANNQQQAGVHVSHAKLAACAAADLAAKKCIQVHGAMGYTWEMDCHIFMKMAWVLHNTWGDDGFHKNQVGKKIFFEKYCLGAGNTFNN